MWSNSSASPTPRIRSSKEFARADGRTYPKPGPRPRRELRDAQPRQVARGTTTIEAVLVASVAVEEAREMLSYFVDHRRAILAASPSVFLRSDGRHVGRGKVAGNAEAGGEPTWRWRSPA